MKDGNLNMKRTSLLDYLNGLEEGELTKEEFGRIMHDPSATDEEIAEALKALQDAGGYENLGD